MRTSPILSVLRIRPFRNLWLGQIFSQIAVNILAFALVITIYERTSSNTAVSLLVLTASLPALLFGLIAGVFVDYWPKESVLFWCNIIRGAILIVLVLSHSVLASIYIISTLVSIVTQFFIPAEAPLIPTLVSPALLFSANSIFTFTYYVTTALGFIISGQLLSAIGQTQTFIVIGILLFLAAFFVAQLPSQKTTQTQSIQTIIWRIHNELIESFRYIKKRPGLWEAVLLFSGSQAVITMLAALAPGFADRALSIPLTNATIVVMAPVVAGIIVSSLLLGHLSNHLSRRIMLNTGLVGTGMTLLFLATFVRLGHSTSFLWSVERFVPDPFIIRRVDVAVVLFFLFGLFNAAVVVPVNTFLQEQTPESLRGRVYGLLTALVGGVSAIPVIGAGRLADTIGVGKTLFILALGITSFGAMRVLRSKK